MENYYNPAMNLRMQHLPAEQWSHKPGPLLYYHKEFDLMTADIHDYKKRETCSVVQSQVEELSRPFVPHSNSVKPNGAHVTREDSVSKHQS